MGFVTRGAGLMCHPATIHLIKNVHFVVLNKVALLFAGMQNIPPSRLKATERNLKFYTKDRI